MEYSKGRWQRKREVILRRDEYLCQEAKRYGKSMTANTVHHIYPEEYYPELAFVDWNLISLSNKNHNAMHDRDTHELTELGKKWCERRQKEFNEWMDKRKPPHEIDRNIIDS